MQQRNSATSLYSEIWTSAEFVQRETKVWERSDLHVDATQGKGGRTSLLSEGPYHREAPPYGSVLTTPGTCSQCSSQARASWSLISITKPPLRWPTSCPVLPPCSDAHTKFSFHSAWPLCADGGRRIKKAFPCSKPCHPGILFAFNFHFPEGIVQGGLQGSSWFL